MKQTVQLFLLLLLSSTSAFPQGSLSHVWSRSLSNTAIPGGLVEGRAVTTDAAGNVYVAGRFRDRNDFDPGPGYLQLTSNGQEDVFFAKYTASGALVFVRSFGSVNTDDANAIALDAAGNIYVAGFFAGQCDFDPGPGVVTRGVLGASDFFCAVYTPEGNLIRVISAGGSGNDRALAMAVNPATGDVYLAGLFNGVVTFGTGVSLSASNTDGFFARYNANGTLAFARRIGGTSADQAQAIALDAAGNIYVAGVFQGTSSFNISPAVNLTSAGNQDAFLAKYDPSGLNIFALKMGGTGADLANALAVDAAGNAYVAGEFQNTADFGPDPANHRFTAAGGSDIFFGKYSPTGEYQYVRPIGSTGFERGYGLVLSGTDVIVCGMFSRTVDFQPGDGVVNLVSAGNSNDGFVARYTDAGTLVYAHPMGSTGSDENRAVAVSGTGIAYITGFFLGSVDFDPGPGTTILTAPSASTTNSFVAGYAANGDFTMAALQGGLPTNSSVFAETPRRIRADAAGNVYLCGIFQGEVDFDPGPGTSLLTSNGGNDIFFAKYSPAGALLFARSIGAATNEDVTDMQVDAAGNIYLVGYYKETVDFDPGTGTSNLTNAGGDDLFFAKYDGSGNLVFARGMGGAGNDQCLGLALDAAGNIHLSGFFSQTVDFDPGPGTISLTAAGPSDIFFAKFNPSANLIFAKHVGSTASGVLNEAAYGITVDAAGNIYITGCFLGETDFDPGPGTAIVTAFIPGIEDIFLAKYDPNGNYIFAVKDGNSSGDIGYRVVVDASGNSFVCGVVSSNIYLRKFGPTGDGLAGVNIGQTAYDVANDLALDAAGNVLITGEFTGLANFSQNVQPYNISSVMSTRDAFVAKYSNEMQLEFAYSLGGGNADIGYGVATGPGGQVYFCGVFSGTTSFDIHNGTNFLQPSNNVDAFFARYTDCVPQVPTSFREASAFPRAFTRIISSDCGLLATVQPTSLNGEVRGKVWVENSVPVSNGNPYVARHYEITPAIDPTAASYALSLYFTQAEFDAFNNHPGSTLNLPSDPNDLAGVANMRIGRFGGGSSNGTGLPESYTGISSVVVPSVRWIGTSNLWEVTFSTGGAAGFILQTRTDVITSLRNLPATTIPGLQVYPNPVQSTLQVRMSGTVSGKPLQLRLLDIQGRVVKNWQALPGATLLSLPVGELPAGTYLLEVHDGQRQRQVTKVQKQ
ncbi:MAG TPA: T9SS type A sorting domain-containing protein [Lacibacter sp.]|nr:T9SS type A sorting domain-containing protein [Lacibacter sp.]